MSSLMQNKLAVKVLNEFFVDNGPIISNVGEILLKSAHTTLKTIIKESKYSANLVR